ncbi:MAG: hypothetical protein KatS3mg111_2597 [Pirellulaceae bacterium]|nr:MAG: hypothetical protein KatS3mg111_2597 [Pirellulaceae bacterium]
MMSGRDLHALGDEAGERVVETGRIGHQANPRPARLGGEEERRHDLAMPLGRALLGAVATARDTLYG